MKSETKIYLIRHGAIENPDDVIYGRLPGFGLSEKGKEQVRQLAQILNSKGIKFDVIYSSPLDRAVQTAQILNNQVGDTDIEIREELSDVSHASLEGQPLDVLRKVEFDAYRPEFLVEGGETPQAIINRTKQLLDEVKQKHRSETIALVSHGDPIRLLLWSLQNPDRQPSTSNLRDKDYVGPAQACVLHFDNQGRFARFEHIRRESESLQEEDPNKQRLKEA